MTYAKVFTEMQKGRGKKYDTLILDTLLSLPIRNLS